MEYKKNLKYFRQPKLKFDIFLIIVGVALFFPHNGAVFGVIFLVIGILLIVRQYRNRSSDGDMDAQLNGAVANVVEVAKQKLNLDDDQIQLVDPLLFCGYRLENALTKKGKDGRMRSSVGTATVFFFEEGGIHTYDTNFSMVKPEEAQETHFISFKQVTSVSSNSHMETVKGGSVTMETLRIERGDKPPLWITLPQSDGVVRAMNGAREFIRERTKQS